MKKTLIIKLILSVILISTVSSNDIFYIFQDTKIKSDNEKIANIYLGVPVKLTKDLGDKAKIAINGFIDGKNVYSTKNKELLIATLEDGFKPNNKQENEVELVGIIDKQYLTKDSKEVWEEHEEFFFDMCTQCHAAQDVKHHTMVEWEALFLPMKDFAKLDEAESKYLLRYLKSNASNGLTNDLN